MWILLHLETSRFILNKHLRCGAPQFQAQHFPSVPTTVLWALSKLQWKPSGEQRLRQGQKLLAQRGVRVKHKEHAMHKSIYEKWWVDGVRRSGRDWGAIKD